MRLIDKELVLTALGEEGADLAIRGAKFVNVITEEIYPADVAIKNGRIAYVGDVRHCIGPGTKTIDASDRYLVPGLIEPHLHPESATLTMTRLAEALVPLGTTTIFAAMDETWSVTGLEGVKFALEEARQTPLRVIYHPYAKCPVTGFEPSSTPGHRFELDDLRTVLEWPDTVGTMDTVIDWVLAFDEDIIQKMEYMQSKGLLVHGHDGFQSARRMQAFLTTGIRSDHVPFTAEEALEKLRNGMWVMFCDGPINHVLPDSIKAITETGISTRHATFCIDDLEARDALETGHIDHQIRTAIACGLDPIRAVQMATLNAAEAHRMDHLIGSITPGRFADILIVSDLTRFRTEKVIASGELVAEKGEMLKALASPKYPAYFYNTFHLARPVGASDLVITTDENARKAKVLVLSVPPETPIRHRSEAMLDVVNGVIQSDPGNDILYCAIVERHKKTGNIGLGFVSGFKLNGGTMATSLGSPCCNIMCLGSTPEDMAIAVNYLAEIGGGEVLVKDGKIVEEIRLPLGGFMDDLPPKEMAEKERVITRLLHAWGCPIERPFTFLMMMEIVPLPEYAITEFGVVKTEALKYVESVLEIVR